MKQFDVAAIGGACIDILLGVTSLPGRGAKTVGRQLGQQIGGTVANCACTMAQLGLSVTSVSCVGTDFHGQAITDDFKKYNVNRDFMEQREGFKANLAVIFLDNTGEKSLIYAPGDEDDWNAERTREAIIRSRYLYTMPADLNKFRKLAEFAHQAQTKIVVDIEPHICETPEDLEAILTLTDVVIFNHEGYVKNYQQEPHVDHLAEICRRYHLIAAVVTLDARGVMAATQDENATFPGFPVDVVDTTGAGDTFNGAFIFSLIRHKPLRDALAFASAAAAINISYLGARGHLSIPEEVDAFLCSQSPGR